MSRDKQIEEMAKFVCNACEMGGGFEGECVEGSNYRECGISRETAEALYNAGYRKIHDDHQRQCPCYALGCQMAEQLEKKVAEKIFAEIEEMLNMQAKIVCKTRETAKEADEPMISWIAMLDGRIYSLRVVEEHIAELKKKYVGKDINAPTNTEEK